MSKRRIILIFSLVLMLFQCNKKKEYTSENTTEANDQSAIRWGNALYINLSTGDSYNYLGKTITLKENISNYSVVEVDGVSEKLMVARRSLPKVINGVRVFVADNVNVKNLTTDLHIHNLLKKDALICLSDPSKPLLPTGRYTFPISRRDGYDWKMEASSHMYAYLGLAAWKAPDYYRSHEGMDINMHEARGLQKHPLVAIEDGTVSWVEDKDLDKAGKEGCILIQSASQPEIYYIYKHMNNKYIFVKNDQKVQMGDTLGYIWGDHTWGHLHMGIVSIDKEPEYENRYTNTLTFFPQFYELWFGDLEMREKVRNEGRFKFNEYYDVSRNFRRSAGYDAVIGYGWELGDWCTAWAVEQSKSDNNFNVGFKKTLFKGWKAESINPNNWYEFSVKVENGNYLVKAKVGDAENDSWQQVEFEGQPAGTYDLKADELVWTPEKEVEIRDEKLTIKFFLKDDHTYAGIGQLDFKKL